MARYYFHTDDGGVFRDEEGIELPTLVAAQHEATRVLGEMLKEHPAAFWDDGGLRLTVTDDRGLVLFMLDASPTIAPAAGSLAPPRSPPGSG